MYKCKYFSVQELVSPIVYNRWKEQAWMFFDEQTLKDLDYIREKWGSPIIINNWTNGGQLKQCGLRSNLDQIVMDKSKARELYLSGHTMCRAFDLHDALGRNLKLYDFCLKLLKRGELKSFQRLESWEKTHTSGGWVHMDSFQKNEPNQFTF